MACKTLLCVMIGRGEEAPSLPGLDAAIALARREDAHLEVLAVGLDQTQLGYFYAGASMLVLQETITRAETDSEAIEAAVRKRLGREDIRWSVDRAVAQIGSLAGLVGQRARFADMVVMPRPYGEGRDQAEEAALEAALFDGGVPVLILPDGAVDVPKFDRVVVAWNQSYEALSAVRQALPILQRAEMVDITVIDPPSYGPERSDPGGQLSQWLSRHGVRAEVSVLAKTLPRVSEVLMRHVRDRDADLVVMGAYGKSRFREAILGGATREMLAETTAPVFMAR